MRTLNLSDIEFHRLGALEQDMLQRANAHGDAARKAIERGDFKAAATRYEASLALYQEAVLVTRLNHAMVSKLADLHDQRQRAEQAHEEATAAAATWPIPGLVNLNHPDGDYAMPGGELHVQRNPRWGVTTVVGTEEAEASLGPLPQEADNGAVMYLRVQTQGAELEPRALYAPLSAAQWRALNQLAERIAHDLPIPYDEDGRTVIAGGLT